MQTTVMELPQAAGMKATQDEEILGLISQLAQGRISPLKVARRTAVRWALAHTEGNVSHAAEMLGISRGTIYRYARS